MLFSRRKKYINALNKQIKCVNRTLKVYNDSLNGLLVQRERIKTLSNLSDEDRKGQFDFIDEKINSMMKYIDSCESKIKSLNDEYERVIKNGSKL